MKGRQRNLRDQKEEMDMGRGERVEEERGIEIVGLQRVTKEKVEVRWKEESKKRRRCIE